MPRARALRTALPHVDPLPRAQLPELEPLFQLVEATMGFVPNSLLTRARTPDILRAFSSIDPGLKQLVAHVASNTTGCRYCQARALAALTFRHAAASTTAGICT